jgi:endoglucanase
MPFWRHLVAVPYPSSVNNVAPLADSLSDDVSRLLVMRYGYEQWNGARIRAEIQQIATWATKRNVRLMCNEFGVYRRVAPASDRARWIGDVRTALEMHGIGWTMWDYAGDFGLVTKQAGQSVVDDVIVSALGLDPRS